MVSKSSLRAGESYSYSYELCNVFLMFQLVDSAPVVAPWIVWSPQLLILISSCCSFPKRSIWSFSRNLRLAIGPSIDTSNILLVSSLNSACVNWINKSWCVPCPYSMTVLSVIIPTLVKRNNKAIRFLQRIIQYK